MNYYYMDEQSREIGPVSADNLKSFRIAGVIKDHTLVRSEVGGPWTACVAITGSMAPAPSQQSEAAKRVLSALADGAATLSHLLGDPVGRLASGFEKLGPKRAGAVGILFLSVYALVSTFFLNSLVSALTSVSFGAMQVSLDIASFLKLLLASVASAGAFVGALALARILNQRGGQWERDAFVAGAVSLVWSLALILGAVVGWKNFEVWAILVLITVCVTVLQIYAGLTRLSGLSEPRATVSVPLVLAIELWSTKIIFAALSR
jgi:hypothetical protein